MNWTPLWARPLGVAAVCGLVLYSCKMPGAAQSPADAANTAADVGPATGGYTYGNYATQTTPYTATATATGTLTATGTETSTLGGIGTEYSAVNPNDPFGGSRFQVITDIRITPENSHIVGGNGCLPGYAAVGSFADCGGGRCLGDQVVCVQKVELDLLVPVSSVYTGFTMTPEGTHVAGGYPCATGFAPIGAVTDCGGGSCYGDQPICKLTVPRGRITRGMGFLTDISITPQNTHAFGGTPCPVGSSLIATTADCGSGRCSGNQSICVRTQTP